MRTWNAFKVLFRKHPFFAVFMVLMLVASVVMVCLMWWSLVYASLIVGLDWYLVLLDVAVTVYGVAGWWGISEDMRRIYG